MAYAWNNSEPQQQQNSELTWEERNFMEEVEEQQKEVKPDFSEYEWMVNSEEFDSQAMQQIEQDDDLDDMFYWDPSKGCTKGKSTVKKEQQQQAQTENNNSLFQNFNNQQFQSFPSFQNVQNNQKQTDKNSFITNPFSSNFQNKLPEINQNQNNNASSQNFNNNNNKQEQQKNNIPGDDLARAMGGVNLNKFNLNPEATTFVPSWMKK